MPKQQGQILLLALVFMAIVTTIVVSLVGYAGIQIKAHRQAVAREQGINISEAGAELAIWKLNNQGGYTGETNTAYANGVYSVTITNLSASSKLIKVDSYIPNATNPLSHRIVQIIANTGSNNISFNYGAQVDSGGIAMDNGSKVVGNVYSNGNITGSGRITGDAFVSGSSGTIDNVNVDNNAAAHNIKNNTVGKDANGTALTNATVDGNASFDSISSCTINGNAQYNTRANCSVSGTTTAPNPSVPADPAYQALPIDAATITQWENDAAEGGTVGSQTVSGSSSLGPKKISGNLTVNNGGTLTVTGTLWVTGSITLNNNAIIKLDASYGSFSGIVLAGVSGSSTAGAIDISNNSDAQGSGVSGSFIMLLSEMNSSSNTAISLSNNTTGAIYYAGSGVIDVSNNADAKEITAYKIHLNNNATITYDSGLANANFSSGSGAGAGWQYQAQSWQLLQ
jgi:hypothetical protein